MLTLGGLELLGLGSSADTSSKSSERDDLLVLLDVGKVGVGFLEVHSCRFSTMLQRMIWRDEPLRAAATSRMFLKCVRTYSPRALASGRSVKVVGVKDGERVYLTHTFPGWRPRSGQKSIGPVGVS